LVYVFSNLLVQSHHRTTKMVDVVKFAHFVNLEYFEFQHLARLAVRFRLHRPNRLQTEVVRFCEAVRFAANRYFRILFRHFRIRKLLLQRLRTQLTRFRQYHFHYFLRLKKFKVHEEKFTKKCSTKKFKEKSSRRKVYENDQPKCSTKKFMKKVHEKSS